MYFSHIAILPGITTEGHRAIMMKINTPEPEDYDLETQMKRVLMMMETYLQNGVDFSGLIVIHDFENLKLGHLAQFNIPLLKSMAAGMVRKQFSEVN